MFSYVFPISVKYKLWFISELASPCCQPFIEGTANICNKSSFIAKWISQRSIYCTERNVFGKHSPLYTQVRCRVSFYNYYKNVYTVCTANAAPPTERSHMIVISQESHILMFSVPQYSIYMVLSAMMELRVCHKIWH